MKTLLWKEFRQNRRVFVASLIFALIPYVIVALLALVQCLQLGTIGSSMEWARYAENASGSALLVSVALCALLAGNVVAGERADRCSEFASYIPIPRTEALASKLLVALFGNLFFLISNGVILLVVTTWQNTVLRTIGSVNSLWLIGAAAAFLFGLSWLLSTLLRTPAIAVGGALVGIQSLGLAMALLEEIYPGIASETGVVFVVACLSLGLICLCSGAWVFLRRVEA